MNSFDPRAVPVRSAHFIGGEYVQMRTNEPMLDVSRPSDGETYASLPIGDASRVDHAVENASRAWRKSGCATMAP